MAGTVVHRASSGMLIRADRVLLVHRSPAKKWYPNVWDFPGGHLEPGETHVEALIREIREELDVEISPPEGKALLTMRGDGVVLKIWKIEAWDGEVANAAPDEHDDLGWFGLAAANQLDLADQAYRALFDQVLG